MYVKVFTQILDSSLAKDRRLRHFFIDLLLCSDADGNVVMTKEAIRKRIGATMEEVEWGLEELGKPDAESLTKEFEGRRVIPLDGHGYGWKIVNYAYYRDIKSDKQRREETNERVRKWREKQRVGKAFKDLSPGEQETYKKSFDGNYKRHRKDGRPFTADLKAAGKAAGGAAAVNDGYREATA